MQKKWEVGDRFIITMGKLEVKGRVISSISCKRCLVKNYYKDSDENVCSEQLLRVLFDNFEIYGGYCGRERYREKGGIKRDKQVCKA